MANESSLHWIDILIIVLYLIFVLAIGVWSSIKARGSGINGYFLAGRQMNWFLVGSSLIGSNIGSEHLVGLAGSGAASGIGMASFELMALAVLVLTGWIFIPVYIASGVYTMPEYVKKRFGGRRIQIYISFITFLFYIFTNVAADLFAGAIFIKITLGWNLYWAILLQLSVACISTAVGGLRAVMWTDTVQVLIMFIGSISLMVISFQKVGGYFAMTEKYFLATPNSTVAHSESLKCAGIPAQDALKLVKPIDNPELPWLGATFGYYSMATWYFCANQNIVQKVLSSKNYSHAKGGCILAAMYKLLPLWLMTFPGMIARILYADELACTDPEICEKTCYSRNGCSNIAYPLLVVRLLPTGFRGIMVAVMMSAIMSTLSSIFNSVSSIFTIDIWTLIRKKPSNTELLIVGRASIFIMVAVAICWIPVVASFPNSQLFVYVQSVTTYLAPPLSATFTLAILVPMINEKVHYLHFGIFLFAITCLVNVTISWFTREMDDRQKANGLTYWTRRSAYCSNAAAVNDYDDINRIKNQEPQDSKQHSTLKRLFYFMCCLKERSVVDRDTKACSDDHKRSLKETKFWRIVTNILAIFILAMEIFIYTFWS